MSATRKRVAGKCILCGTWRAGLHKDHIIPKCKGGTDNSNNIQMICANCHQDKTWLDLKNAPYLIEHGRRLGLSQKGRKMSNHFCVTQSLLVKHRYYSKWPDGRKATCCPDKKYYAKNLCEECYRSTNEKGGKIFQTNKRQAMLAQVELPTED